MITNRYRNWRIQFDEYSEKWLAHDIYGDGCRLENHSLRLLKEEIDSREAATPEVILFDGAHYGIVKVAEFLEDGTAVIAGQRDGRMIEPNRYYRVTPNTLATMTILNTLISQKNSIGVEIAEAERLMREQSLLADTATTNAQTNN